VRIGVLHTRWYSSARVTVSVFSVDTIPSAFHGNSGRLGQSLGFKNKSNEE
jgi:hypothetical protein